MRLFRHVGSPGIIALLIASFCGTLLLSSVAAADCGEINTSIINCEKSGGKDVDGIWTILLMAINILTAGVAVVAVGGIVYGSFLYATSASDESQLSKAKEIIRNTIVGLIAFAFMYSILQFLIPGGVFGGGGPLLASPRAKQPVSTMPYPQSGNSGGSQGGPSSSVGSSPTNGFVCYNVTKLSGQAIQGNYFHKSGSQTYAFENSPEGIRYAARNNYRSIDLDMRVTKDGVLVATHWAQPMVRDRFFDPKGKLPRNTRVENMTFEQVSRLRNQDGKSRIYSYDYMLTVLAKNNVNLSFEIKVPGPTRSRISEIASKMNNAGVKGYLKGAIQLSGMNETLSQARKQGFWTRGTLGSQGWKAPQPSAQCKE